MNVWQGCFHCSSQLSKPGCSHSSLPLPDQPNDTPSLHRQTLQQLAFNGIHKNNFFCLKVGAGFQIPSRYLLKYSVLLLTGVPLTPTRALRPCSEATWLTLPSAVGLGEAQSSVVSWSGFFSPPPSLFLL